MAEPCCVLQPVAALRKYADGTGLGSLSPILPKPNCWRLSGAQICFPETGGVDSALRGRRVEIAYANKRVAKQFANRMELERRYGKSCAVTIMRRITDLQAAPNLAALSFSEDPSARCHELKHDLKGYLAMDVSKSRRLLFAPGNEPIPTKPDGGLDWVRVTSIVIPRVEDYHNG